MSQTLEGLWLGGTNYNDALCQEISKCIRLRNLCLRQAQNITEIGIKSLGKLNTLEKLMLFNISKSNKLLVGAQILFILLYLDICFFMFITILF